MTPGTSDRAAGDSRVTVSVVIAVARNDYALLGRQLRQLSRQVPATPEFEVIVGDNDGRLDPQRLGHSSVRVVDASDRRGAGHARNRAAAEAGGEVLLFCDADDLVGAEWVLEHVKGLASSDLTAGALCVVDTSDPLIDRLSSSPWPTGRFSTRAGCHEGVPIAPSNNMGVRRAAFDEVSGFPVDYLRSQDVALSLALRRAGIRPAFVPGAQVLYVTGTRTPAQRRRIHREIGAARAKLHEDFGVGPGAGSLIVRAAARTVRATFRPVPPRRPPRPPAAELAEFVGIITHVARRS